MMTVEFVLERAVEEPSFPAGRYYAMVDDEAMTAHVYDRDTGKIKKRFTGEVAWSDAARHAGDLNRAAT